ncbi:GntR family transcriptional regulator [Croceicoccus sp. BE223]|uniref:GntR family transcriptional regulator n=1 Tax=Croceicoccus sp. BE223 TaxID=2817716 RepID=UPI0028554EB5|nr:GntR family transcriptional regulator [Croceicoccus sp. BE223]MDR7103085.1 DNA-binding GntR family transcriptional regulator [Croceicoccus sp. BE223]
MSKASDRAYHAIRSSILSGKLLPGEQIVEEALAELVGLSRTPVRDALRRLEAELLVERNETQRTFVANWSLADISDAFELRAIVEGRAARLAAARMTEEALVRLRDANEIVREAVECDRPDVAMFLEGNRAFHTALVEAADSRRLSALLSTLIEQPVIWRTAHHYDHSSLKRSHLDHRELISAFERRDGAWAEAIMRSHILRAYHVYCDAHAQIA